MRLPLPNKSTSENRGRADMLCLSTHGRFVPEADLQNTVQIDAWITPLGSDGPWLGLFPRARERICALSSSRSPQRLPVLKPE